MTTFPTTAEQFYALRDDRTNRCVTEREYQQTECVVIIDRPVVETWPGQITLLVSCELLSRWCRRVKIIMPTTPCHPNLGGSSMELGEFILDRMRDTDPFGTFETTNQLTNTTGIVLHVGDTKTMEHKTRQVFISASGWYARLSKFPFSSLPNTDEANPLGAIAAACLGVSQVFKMAIGFPQEKLIEDGIFNLFRFIYNQEQKPQHISYPTCVNAGRILMVGAGSVGSSAAYCLKLTGLAGELTILDKDVVKVENFNRSPIFGRNNFGQNKAETVAAYFSASKINTKAFPGWWNEYVMQAQGSERNFDMWLPLANDHGVRWSMQNNIPPLMIHSSTTLNWGVNHGRHIPGRDDCLSDRFPETVRVDALTCSTTQIKTNQGSIDAALPFISMFAGLLVTADMVRAQMTDYPQIPNFALFDFGCGFKEIQMWDRKPDLKCICCDQRKYQHINKATKYWNLFRTD
ncbi:MAG: ThiF family adenylyltransferase [Ignavibacteriales bacterium]|nr:ThiF family adenylyltransferase [Ignavibacteriales bacterium]